MALKDSIAGRIGEILRQSWDMRDGRVVPTTANVALAGGGVELTATMLYADLADSTSLAMWDRKVTARLCKAYLACSNMIIHAEGGEVRSFDGDRVMGVFLGERKNTRAARAALKINWMFENALRPAFEKQYAGFQNGTHRLGHSAGIDTSDVLVVRAGVRNSNDLVWVGRAPNVAAKLCGLREPPYASWITGTVFDLIADEAKIYDGQSMWEERLWEGGPVERVYRSSWWWTP